MMHDSRQQMAPLGACHQTQRKRRKHLVHVVLSRVSLALCTEPAVEPPQLTAALPHVGMQAPTPLPAAGAHVVFPNLHGAGPTTLQAITTLATTNPALQPLVLAMIQTMLAMGQPHALPLGLYDSTSAPH